MREQVFAYDSSRVYGMYYEMSGASATTTQFYATDSTQHFLREFYIITVRQTQTA